MFRKTKKNLFEEDPTMTVEEVIRNVIVRLGNISVPVAHMGTIGAQIASCICDLNACLNAKQPGEETKEDGGEQDD